MEFIGKSKHSQRLKNQLDLLKKREVDLLLIGEMGSGRDFCARFLTEGNVTKVDAEFLSDFLKIAPVSIPHLYVDGLENLHPGNQNEIWKLLEKRQIGDTSISGRILFSASPLVFSKIQEKTFREDLFRKISTIRLEIPSLRERKEDILFFVSYFINIFNKRHKKKIENISDKLEEFLVTHSWMGNLAELESFLENQILFSKGKTLDKRGVSKEFLHNLDSHSPRDLSVQPSIPLSVYEKEIIRENLKHFQGNREKTARALGISERNLYRKIKEYNLNEE